jgi:hypothetical protein
MSRVSGNRGCAGNGISCSGFCWSGWLNLFLAEDLGICDRVFPKNHGRRKKIIPKYPCAGTILADKTARCRRTRS